MLSVRLYSSCLTLFLHTHFAPSRWGAEVEPPSRNCVHVLCKHLLVLLVPSDGIDGTFNRESSVKQSTALDRSLSR